MSIFFWLAAMAAFSMILGFQWSRRQRLNAKCKRDGHQWINDQPMIYGRFCANCGTRPNWR